MKTVSALVALSFALGLGTHVIAAETKAAANKPPASIKVKLPNGKEINAYSTRQETPTMATEFVLKGMVKEETSSTGLKALLIESETGQKYVLFNAAYVNTLAKAAGKKVSLKGKDCGVSSFNKIHGYWINDILEVK